MTGRNPSPGEGAQTFCSCGGGGAPPLPCVRIPSTLMFGGSQPARPEGPPEQGEEEASVSPKAPQRLPLGHLPCQSPSLLPSGCPAKCQGAFSEGATALPFAHLSRCAPERDSPARLLCCHPLPPARGTRRERWHTAQGTRALRLRGRGCSRSGSWWAPVRSTGEVVRPHRIRLAGHRGSAPAWASSFEAPQQPWMDVTLPETLECSGLTRFSLFPPRQELTPLAGQGAASPAASSLRSRQSPAGLEQCCGQPHERQERQLRGLQVVALLCSSVSDTLFTSIVQVRAGLSPLLARQGCEKAAYGRDVCCPSWASVLSGGGHSPVAAPTRAVTVKGARSPRRTGAAMGGQRGRKGLC